MLDNDTVSRLLRGKDGVDNIVFQRDIEELRMSAITEAELLYDLKRKPEATRMQRVVKELLDRVKVLPWDSAAAACYGELRAFMERSGRAYLPEDILIAAHAQAAGAILVSANIAFREVPGLVVENWSES
ncbi:MAG: type II toxin-antitoxin system VapC family toxin [Rhizobiaceae bacterium]|nr:MAG: type II toxin-antitoxin system VapC family toxin [Rhizobiaceae bacterium]